MPAVGSAHCGLLGDGVGCVGTADDAGHSQSSDRCRPGSAGVCSSHCSLVRTSFARWIGVVARARVPKVVYTGHRVSIGNITPQEMPLVQSLFIFEHTQHLT